MVFCIKRTLCTLNKIIYMKRNIPYTYLIGWPNLDKWYYGVRYSKTCQPNDLWNPYKTSSNIVKKFIAEHGDPPVKLIRKCFYGKLAIQQAQKWENRVLKKLKVVKKTKWLNGHDSHSFNPQNVPKGDCHWTKQNTPAAKKWLNREGWKSKSLRQGNMPKGNQHWTKKNQEASLRHEIRMHSKDNPNYLEHVRRQKSERLKLNNPVNLPGVKEKIRRSILGRKRPRKICEICSKDVADSIYTKFHGPKCKHAQ